MSRESALKEPINLNEIPSTEEEALQLYIGEKYDYYKKKWSIGRNRKPALVSFNVGGFFGTFWWSAGRAMYLYASFFFLFMFLADLLFLLTGYEVWEDSIYPTVGLVVYGLFGNYNYYYYAMKKVKKMMGENRSRREIIAAGGFRWRRFFACIGLTFIYFLFSVFVLGIG
ncbi:hypothetical protein [Alkalicoccobacillus plakortidis]|uniref:DUF2628 domain-containing protein n=1 Tax=Alkalicoccobacillus plakortidis TaxID=444060 RepID=A0ABT0XK60_9BACI|nr:hypothetical protein [Alkalicoccobacillus plakortidis]MCM2676222.1 hypothetical protein [Alkalicoccobacillus plakortidis]